MRLYGINGKIKEYSQITNGHINETYCIKVENGRYVNPYVFQKVNGDNEEFWRLCVFEENTVTFEVVENPEILKSSGHDFGDAIRFAAADMMEKLDDMCEFVQNCVNK
jgi:hypothetical protein